MKLFDGGDSFEEDISKIEIDKEYARRFEHNKKREDLHKLEELKKKGVINESSDELSSEEEYDDSHLVDPRKDVEFLNALIKAKKGELSKNKETKLFESESEDEEEEEEENIEAARGKSIKPMYLKDVTAKHLIEEGPEFDDVIENNGGSVIKSHSQEMEDMRRAFIDEANAAFSAADGDGELLTEKKRSKEETENDDDLQVLCDEAFGVDDNLDEDDKFLKEYIKKRFWVSDEKEDNNKLTEEDTLDLSEDEELINKQERYEIGYNFRHEENVGDRVLGHSRVIEGSVRKKTNARKTQRERKDERLAQAEFERKEELKHLKNLKKKEIKEKLEKIRETAGIVKDGVCPLDIDDLEDEFDPDKYDRKMREAFNDDYYDADDANPNFESDDEKDDNGKPDFDKEDELLGLPKGWSESGDGFLAARERCLKSRAEGEGEGNDNSDSDSDENEKHERRKASTKEEKEILNKELEEYYKLDYEDTIGDLKTRFKYKEVGSKRYGLSVEEILILDDVELNQYVSLKKLAPYMEKEWKVPREKRYQQKQRNRMLLLEGQGGPSKEHKYNKKKNENDDDKGKSAILEEGGASKESSRSRKRKRQAELKLSRSRLMAYGKIPSSSGKSKTK